MEGYWVLELWHKPRNELVYLLTFAKLGEALLISVVQGPNFEGSKEMVKQLDKNVPWFTPCLFDGRSDESIDESIRF